MDAYTHTFEEIAEKDALKQERLKELGITILRFCDEDIMKNTDGVLQVIRCFIEDYEKRKEHTPLIPSFYRGILGTHPEPLFLEGRAKDTLLSPFPVSEYRTNLFRGESRNDQSESLGTSMNLDTINI